MPKTLSTASGPRPPSSIPCPHHNWPCFGGRCAHATKRAMPSSCARNVASRSTCLCQAPAIPQERDGRDAFFAHHPGMADNCKWGAVGQSPRDIDRLKYGGATEGAQHQRLKAMLATMLQADPAFINVQVEHVISRPPDWRKPDVAATFLDGLAAFDLQLATTQLPTIVARESFYESHGIRYVWITSTSDSHKLARQAFQDIYWNNDGQIFGIDKRADAATLARGELHLSVLTVAPRLGTSGLRSIWERHLVRRSDIDWHTPSGRPRFPGADFDTAVRSLIETRFAGPRRRLIIAVQRPGDAAHLEAGHAWDEIAHRVGAPSWSTTEPDRVFKAIGVLATRGSRQKNGCLSLFVRQIDVNLQRPSGNPSMPRMDYCIAAHRNDAWTGLLARRCQYTEEDRSQSCRRAP